MVTRIYTKTGDAGDTGLFGGRRVQKDDARVEAYGSVDELNAALGLVRAEGPPPQLEQATLELQAILFELGADLATPPGREKRPSVIGAADVQRLEAQIDAAEAQLPPLKTFILPAGTRLAAVLHLSRAICRRAERRVVSLRAAEPDTSVWAVIFLNRLGDLLFVWARLANHAAGAAEVAWRPRDARQ